MFTSSCEEEGIARAESRPAGRLGNVYPELIVYLVLVNENFQCIRNLLCS